MKMIRLGIAIVLAGVIAVFIGLVFFYPGTPPQAPNATSPSQTLAGCKQCHAAVWHEWETSYHSKSFSDDKVQAAFQHFGFDRKCESCHAPQPVFLTGLREPVKLRSDDRESGVNCLSCHALSGGQGVAATRTIADAPCHPIETIELATSEACATCHDAIYQDWAASNYKSKGKSCQSCHMPTLADDTNRRSHFCVGAHDEDHLRSGVEMTCIQKGDELVVAARNHATGHNFPGERHNRILLLQVIQTSEDGTITLSQQDFIKRITPFRGESTAEQIKAGDTYTAKFPVVEPPVTAHVQLLYKMFPYVRDEDAIVVHEKRIELTK